MAELMTTPPLVLLPSPEPTFIPTMPYPVALPWPAPWDGVRVVYDQYACEAWLDAEEAGAAEIRRAGRALDARRKARQTRADALMERNVTLTKRGAAFAAQSAGLPAAQRETIAAQLAAEAAAWEAELPTLLSALQDEEEAWTRDYRTWRKTKALAELRYYVLYVVWPDGTETPSSDPATWERFPLRLLEWLANEGYTQARDALWTAPKADPPAAPPSAA